VVAGQRRQGWRGRAPALVGPAAAPLWQVAANGHFELVTVGGCPSFEKLFPNLSFQQNF